MRLLRLCKGDCMDDIINMARAAKKRLKGNFWADCKRNLSRNTDEAKQKGVSDIKIKSMIEKNLKKEIDGEKSDEFYLKVKQLLDSEGEVSDAIGRLTDREVYDKLSYEEKQRYNLELSNRYLNALKRYRRENELGI